MKIFLVLLVLLSVNPSHSQSKLADIDSNYLNGILSSVGNYNENKEKHGFWRYYNKEGKVINSGNYYEGEKIGKWKRCYDDGDHGVRYIGNFEHGKMHGVWKFYHKNGAIHANGRFSNDFPVGEWNFYFDNDQIMAKGRYDICSFDSLPKLNRRTIQYGVMYAEVESKFPVIERGDCFALGIKSGHWSYFYSNGQLHQEGAFVADLPEGSWTFYFENGNPKTIGSYNKGLQHGEWHFYEKNGQIESKAIFSDGVYTSWCQYHPNGVLQQKLEFNDGRVWNIIICQDSNGNEKEGGTLKNGNGTLFKYDSEGNILFVNNFVNGFQTK